MSCQTYQGLSKNLLHQSRVMPTWALLLGVSIIALSGVSYPQNGPITSSGLHTQVSSPVDLSGGVTQYNITGGTRPRDGANLFHSFREFGVPANNIANFQNDSGQDTSNILSRVTGGNPSNILGTIQTTDFGNANLFLMNPTGIIFGADSSLNVGGAAHFTTADYIKLGDDIQFTATPSGQDVLLSVAPVAAFGFLQSSPEHISVDGSTLSVGEGQVISLIGGDISIGSGLKAPGGEVRIASVASQGEILHTNFDSAPNVNGESFSERGTISLLQDARLDVSNDAAGTVIIRGGQLQMTNSTISADTINVNGAPTAIDVKVTDDISITDTQGQSAMTARTTGVGNAGGMLISSRNLEATSSSLLPFALIDTHTTGTGVGGHVSIISTDTMTVNGELADRFYFIDSGTIGLNGGLGGDISITARDIQFDNIVINTGDEFGRTVLLESSTIGSGGNLITNADTFLMNESQIYTDSFVFGKAGNLAISARDIQLTEFNTISLAEFSGGSTFTLTGDNLTVETSQIEAQTIMGRGVGVPWTGIVIDAEIVEFRNASTVRSQVLGDGASGDIHITATERLTLSDNPESPSIIIRPTGLFTNSLGFLGKQGSAGAIIVETGALDISGGARIDTTTQTSGLGGDVTITANDMSISGARQFTVLEFDIFGLGSSRPSGVFSRSVGSFFCTGPCGDAGNITINTGSLNVIDGAVLDSGTTSTGKGGTITINASDNISLAGTLDNGTPSGIFSRTTGIAPGSGEGGKISLTAGQSFTLSNGAAVSANSSGPANAGDIDLTATDTLLIENGTVTTRAENASGGNIKLTANEMIHLIDSTIESSVQGNQTTAGGDISLDPRFVILQNSQLLATARDGLGGNIQITGGQILQDPFTRIDASSQTGINGTVNIRGPIQNLSETIAPLPEALIKIAAMFAARCAAQKGGKFSSFLQGGRDGTPPGATNFLPSPLTFSTTGPEGTTSVVSRLGFDDRKVETEWRFFDTTHTADLAQSCSAVPATRS